MLFHKIDFAKIILNQYAETWFIWIGFFILGIFLVKYTENLALTKREANKMTSAGAGLIAIALVVHFGIIWSLLVS
jgi:CDP-diglyceride synthetase